MYLSNEKTTATTATGPTTTAPETAPLIRPHPALKSLWNIPHLIRFPDPLPPLPEIRKLIRNRIAELIAQRRDLDPTAANYATCVCGYTSEIGSLENRLEELQKHFPGEFDAAAEESQATAPETENYTPEPGKKSETPLPQQTQTRNEPGMNPE